MPQQPSVTIVIPAYNEECYIGKCLDSCIDQTSAPEEIIVVSNKSTDNTAAIVRRYQAQHPHIDIQLLEQNEHQGIAPTRNHGFDHARSDIIARTDADSVIARDWVGDHSPPVRGSGRRRGQRPHRLSRHAAAGVPVLGRLHPARQGAPVRRNERFLIGANMAIRAQAWKSVRQLTHLDLEDRLHEEVDLALTLFKNDFEIAYEPGMVAAMSARRVESSPRDFYRYVTHYTRTTDLHGIRSPAAYTAISTLLLLYFPFRARRFFYDVDNRRFTSSKLRDKLRGQRSRARDGDDRRR
ncbi:glycosyltransferase, group 2 family protein [Mycobacterium parascrofulaceum ATCC BAA-614]|uniref:Glycosyltransferase, group 2 family protein n=1 Tax=Mycobacterium parascrofulaceum ATCC BAA-614 TaxID=525368 RepID=D5P7A7_9MYCO|nr:MULTISPECIES: glycosyltransferase family 2 protein [Mycobacterium]EFG78052.1 glycosyltransferase, group 2 family protein [Mycobacterium parascrofulaceum ATCC BAA-614]